MSPTQPLKILYVGTLPPHPGGSAISGALLVEGFAAAGHEVRALAPITAETLEACDTFPAIHPRIRVSRFLVPYFDSAPDKPPPGDYREREGAALRPMLSEAIDDQRPDVILMGRESFAWHVPDSASMAKVPCVLRLAGCTALGILRGTYPYSLAQTLLGQFRKADLIVSPARHLAESLRSLGVERIRVIPNGLDLGRFFPQVKPPALMHELRISASEIVAMHISNMKSLKRVMDLVPCAAQALRQNPRLLFVVVGDGPCRQDLETACAERGISDRFRFTGWVNYARIPQYINLANVVLMPCEAETQARVYLETQACGRVLIASDVPGAREVIRDGETGLLFPKGDISEMTRVLLETAADPARQAAIGAKAREQAQEHSTHHCVAAYLEALSQVARRGSRRL